MRETICGWTGTQQTGLLSQGRRQWPLKSGSGVDSEVVELLRLIGQLKKCNQGKGQVNSPWGRVWGNQAEFGKNKPLMNHVILWAGVCLQVGAGPSPQGIRLSPPRPHFVQLAQVALGLRVKRMLPASAPGVQHDAVRRAAWRQPLDAQLRHLGVAAALVVLPAAAAPAAAEPAGQAGREQAGALLVRCGDLTMLTQPAQHCRSGCANSQQPASQVGTSPAHLLGLHLATLRKSCSARSAAALAPSSIVPRTAPAQSALAPIRAHRAASEAACARSAVVWVPTAVHTQYVLWVSG